MTTDTNPNSDAEKEAAMMTAFIDKITPKLAETIMTSIDAKVEERLKGISSKNDELLGKLHTSKTEKSTIEEQLAALSKQLTDSSAPVTEVTIGKQDARDPRKYAAAKAKAEAAGVTLQIDRDA